MVGENPYFNQWATEVRLPRQWLTWSDDGCAVVWACDVLEADRRGTAILGGFNGCFVLPRRRDGR